MQKRKEDKKRQEEQKRLMMSKSVLQGFGKSKHKKKGNKANDVGHFLSNYGKVGFYKQSFY